ncbi:MAG: hypothetical protein WC668_02690 [Patescibacteria group bacterium]
MTPETGTDWLFFNIAMVALLVSSSIATRKFGTRRGKLLWLFLLVFAVFLTSMMFATTAFENSHASFIYLAITGFVLVVTGLACGEKGRFVIMAIMVPLLLLVIAFSPGGERYLLQQWEAKLQQEEIIKQQAQILADYFCGTEIDAEDAWWLSWPDYGIAHMIRNKKIFLPIVCAAENRQYQDLWEWWEERGMSRMRVNFSLQIKTDTLPITGTEIRNQRFIK